MTFSGMPFPQSVPCRLTALKIRPWPILAAMIQRSTASLTHMGIGTVLTRLPLPIKSTMAQCPCLISMSSTSRADGSAARRKPQPKSRTHHGKITNAAKILAIGIFQEQLGLIAAQLVPQTGSQLLHTFHEAEAS